jgi:hypothetical protein
VLPVPTRSVEQRSMSREDNTAPARRIRDLSAVAPAHAAVGSLGRNSVLRAANRCEDECADTRRFRRGRRRCVPRRAVGLIHHRAVELPAVAAVPDLLIQQAIADLVLTADAKIDGRTDGRASSSGGGCDNGEEQGDREERGAKEHERGLHDWHFFRPFLWNDKKTLLL